MFLQLGFFALLIWLLHLPMLLAQPRSGHDPDPYIPKDMIVLEGLEVDGDVDPTFKQLRNLAAPPNCYFVDENPRNLKWHCAYTGGDTAEWVASLAFPFRSYGDCELS